jgi:ribosome biogenesis GTPase A
MAFRRDRGRKKSGGTLREQVRLSDVVIEMIDCRDMRSTRNLKLESWIGGRLLIVANKADLATPAQLRHVSERGFLAINAKDGGSHAREQLLAAILRKSDVRPLRVSIMGFPNVGKSTLTNLLIGKRAARVAPIAGTTKKKEHFKVSEDIILVDYPGMFPSKMNEVWLASRGAINVDGLDDPEYYFEKIFEKDGNNPDFFPWLNVTFNLSLAPGLSAEEIMEAVARRRKLILKGNEPNTREAAKILLRALTEAPF